MDGVIWVVRAGEKARFAQEFLQERHIAVGFRDVASDDVSGMSEADLRARVVDARQRNATGQLISFALRMSAGDLVVTPRLQLSRDYLVGRVGAYEHHPEDPASGPHRRRVTWLGTFDHDTVGEAVLNSLGAIQTVFRPTAVEAELRSVLTRLRPLPAGAEPPTPRDSATTSPTGVASSAAPTVTSAVWAPSLDGPVAPAKVTATRGLARADLDVSLDEVGRTRITCHHPALVMDQVPRHIDPGTEWDGSPGVYVLTGTDLAHAAVRTGIERTLTTTLIVKPWAYVGLSEDFRGRLSSHRATKPEWRRALLVRSGAHPFSSDDIRYLELAIHQALDATEEVTLAQATPRGNLSAQPRNTALLDACAATVVSVLRLTGTLI
ncbi:hypothetical protein ACFFKU_11995 [Kineococcus gynurae]|uniref:GIY-YIG nuclease family protein n=1 Tax=Kineococcus gynurae TaxID=452979 RepID=A0ABV5LQY4_9ACTN